MASFKSKHQNQYQWQEVQDLVHNFAKQVRAKHEREQKETIQEPLFHQDTPDQEIPSSILSPAQHTSQKSSSTIPPLPDDELKIDLQRFREAWEKQQVKQHEPETPESNHSVSPLAHSQTPSLVPWDFENNRPLPKSENTRKRPEIQATSQSSQPTKQGVQTGNPWEMLRDHFIALRERRIALEKQKNSESKT